MSGKLDQSLDEILSTRRKTAGRRGRGGRRAGTGTKAAAAAPVVGGIQKNTRGAKAAPAKSAVPSGPAAGNGESKIIVSNLVRSLDENLNMVQQLTSLAFRCERGPDQGMLNLRPPLVGLFRRRFYDTRLLRPFSIFRGATHFPLSMSSYPVGQHEKKA